MVTTTTAMPAHRDKYGFPLVHCTRCGGSGHYSYNAMHGSRCYGCNGTGWKIARPAAKARDEFTAAQRAGWEATVFGTTVHGAIEIGDELNRAKGDPWMTVAAIDVDYTQPCGWTGTISADTANAWRGTITFTDGTVWNVMTNCIYRRRRLTESAPYVERALAAWRRAGCPGGVR